jgi:uncharacterized protein YbgA (DUF1722 family)
MNLQEAINKITEVGAQLMNHKNPEIKELGTLVLAIPISFQKSEDMEELTSIVFEFIRERKKREDQIKELLK